MWHYGDKKEEKVILIQLKTTNLRKRGRKKEDNRVNS